MEMQNEHKRELSEQVSRNASTLGLSCKSQDGDQREANPSYQVDRILAACEHPHDLDLLIRTATARGGLINDHVRKVACKSCIGFKCLRSPTLTATEGLCYLVTGAKGLSSPDLLAPGRISRPIKTNIKSSLT